MLLITQEIFLSMVIRSIMFVNLVATVMNSYNEQ